MRPKINVIDLDGTLVPYDSFQKYALTFLKNRKSLLKIILSSALRVMKMIDAGTFKKTVIMTARRVENYEEIMRKFASKLYDDIDMKIMEIINKHNDLMTTNVLCTASAEDYTRYLAELLQWEYVCSRIDEERQVFIHLYGKNKINAIEHLYPSNEYIYNFAVSDSLDDEELLSRFEHSILLTK
jgi:phosphoserine phosphatase